jgi:dTDP-4-dehydrorhamnose reductase
MKLLLLGNTGQLGWELNRTLAPLGDLIALDYPQLDLTNMKQTRQIIQNIQPQVIVNATAYTAVDRAEQEIDLATMINAVAPGVIAEEASRISAALIHYSTDYIFDGEKKSDYLETDTPNPLNAYGVTKLRGEQAVADVGGAHLILRTSMVYSLRRDNFLLKVLHWARTQPVLKMVTDQVGNPTWARMLAETTALLLAAGGQDVTSWVGKNRGIYHLAGWGSTTRYNFAKAVLEFDPQKEQQTCKDILPALTTDFPTPARRPLYCGLNCDKFARIFGLKMPDWDVALRLALHET